MKLLCGVLLFIGVFTLNNAKSQITLNRIGTDQLMMQQLMSTRAGNPDYTIPCFQLYVPIQSDVLNQYATSYEKCGTDAQAQNVILNDEAAQNRTLINASAENVSGSMTDCSALDDSLAFFDCYSQVGSGNIDSLITVTFNASAVAGNLREQYRVVENNLESCQNASQKAYVQSTAEVTKAWDDCLLNGPPQVVTTTTPEPEPETSTIDSETTESTVTEEVEEAFEEEDLSRSAPLLAVNKHKRSINGRGHFNKQR